MRMLVGRLAAVIALSTAALGLTAGTATAMPISCNTLFGLLVTDHHMMSQYSVGSSGYNYWAYMYQKHETMYAANC